MDDTTRRALARKLIAAKRMLLTAVAADPCAANIDSLAELDQLIRRMRRRSQLIKS